jgi:hypothetical protein
MTSIEVGEGRPSSRRGDRHGVRQQHCHGRRACNCSAGQFVTRLIRLNRRRYLSEWRTSLRHRLGFPEDGRERGRLGLSPDPVLVLRDETETEFRDVGRDKGNAREHGAVGQHCVRRHLLVPLQAPENGSLTTFHQPPRPPKGWSCSAFVQPSPLSPFNSQPSRRATSTSSDRGASPARRVRPTYSPAAAGSSVRGSSR